MSLSGDVEPHNSQQPTANSQQANSRPRSGLGRGLGALIPRAQAGLQELDLDRIAPNPQQPRLRFDEAGLAELAASIREHGVLQPVVVTRVEGQAEGYFLVAGERRWRAARLAGLQTVPAIVKEAAPLQRLELALVENLQREDLAPLEMAAAYRALVDDHGLTQEQIARRVGRSRASVANTLRLLQLPRPAREALAAGRLTEGHARALLANLDEPTQLAALTEIVDRGLSVRQAEELARRLGERESGGRREGGREGRREGETAEVAYLEERFRQALGTKVEIVASRRGGRLVIHYYSDEELQGLFERICGE